MKNNNKIMKTFFAIALLLGTGFSFADELPPDFDIEDGVQDAPGTPIDAYLWLLIVISLGYVFFKFKKDTKKVRSTM